MVLKDSKNTLGSKCAICTTYKSHESKCTSSSDECLFTSTYSQYHPIAIDSGIFQRIIHHTCQLEQAHDTGSNHCEPPFLSPENQTCIEAVLRPYQNGNITCSTLGSITISLIKMAGTQRRQRAVSFKQLPMFEKKQAAPQITI